MITPYPLRKLIEKIEFVPQAIVSEDVTSLVRRTGLEIEEGQDDFDRFVGGGAWLEKFEIFFALMHYKGHPKGKTTIYLPIDILYIDEIREIIAQISLELGLEDKIEWQRDQVTSNDALPIWFTEQEIELKVNDFRSKLGLSKDEVFNIVELLQSSVPRIIDDFVLQIATLGDLDVTSAYTVHNPPRIVVREDVYNLAKQDHPLNRSILAHELGHVVLHGLSHRAFRSSSIYHPKFARRLIRLEEQAHRFGAFFLMPRFLVDRYQNPAALALACKVSLREAQFRLSKVESRQQAERVTREFLKLMTRFKHPE
jgi:hypothetical protein